MCVQAEPFYGSDFAGLSAAGGVVQENFSRELGYYFTILSVPKRRPGIPETG